MEKDIGINKPQQCNCSNGMVINEKNEVDYCKNCNCFGYIVKNDVTLE